MWLCTTTQLCFRGLLHVSGARKAVVSLSLGYLKSRTRSLRSHRVRYNRVFMFFYPFSLHGASFLIVNFSWIKAHVESILHHPAQFRPEKGHRTQLLALSSLLEPYPEYRNRPVLMVLMGTNRNAGDVERVKRLRATTTDLHLEVWRSKALAVGGP